MSAATQNPPSEKAEDEEDDLSGLEEAADDGFVPDANIDDQLEELEKKAKEEEEKESADSVAAGKTKLEEKKHREELARLDRERIKLLRAEQKKQLDKLRNQQNQEISGTQDSLAKARLKFMLEQTEIFTHFVKGGHQESHPKEEQTPAKRGPGRPRRGADEARDDVDNDEDADESKFISAWTVSPPFVKNGQMKDYQLAGLNWLIKLYDNGINGILADEMGLGKTLQTLSFLCYLKEIRGVHGPHIIVAPKSTVQNWLNEFRKWVPSMKVFGFMGSKEEREEIKAKNLIAGKFDAVVTTYEVAIREKAALRKFTWRYIVIDEAHRIKNEKSVLSQVVRLYNTQYRLLLTGTPLQNNLHELWALLNFLLPDVFTSAEDFDAWFDLKGGDNQREVVTRLHSVLRPFLLRRIKAEVARGLPPKTEVKVFVGMSELQREWYKKVLLKDLDAINAGDTNKGNAARVRLQNILMQLRKVCNHPYLFPGAEPGPPYENGEHLIKASGKMVILDKLLSKLQERGSRVLLFTQMTRVLDILEDYMVWRGYEYCRIDGNTDGVDRADQIEDYNSEGSKKFVFLLSTRAGGLGINLATADSVILFDSDWNPQVDLQAQDRAHRIGQKKPVTIYRFVTQDAIEEKIIERAEMKLRLDALVIQQGRLVEQNKALSKDEMLTIIKFGADEIFKSKESTISDEDIDAIIAKGQAKTKELDEKLSKNSENLLELVLNDDNNFNMWAFQGVDYKKGKLNPGVSGFIEPPRRERGQKSYNEKEYYRNVLYSTTGGPGKRPGAARPPKQPAVHPHQFFPKRLYELIDKETNAWKQAEMIKERRAAEGGFVMDVDQADEEVDGLTAEEEEEKKQLLEKHNEFLEWSKREYLAFLKGCEKYGRTAYADIAKEVESKSEDSVKRYAAIFWKRGKELSDWDKVVGTIERGEQRLKRRDEVIELLHKKVSSTKDPWKSLKIPYAGATKSRYTEEEDIFLLCALDQVGYGNWEELKNVKRCEALIKILEKEAGDKEPAKKGGKKADDEDKNPKKRGRDDKETPAAAPENKKKKR